MKVEMNKISTGIHRQSVNNLHWLLKFHQDNLGLVIPYNFHGDRFISFEGLWATHMKYLKHCFRLIFISMTMLNEKLMNNFEGYYMKYY